METHMSRGLGRVQRTILRTMQAAPDQAFTAKQLCGVVYRVTVKRHRRVVLRAGIQLGAQLLVERSIGSRRLRVGKLSERPNRVFFVRRSRVRFVRLPTPAYYDCAEIIALGAETGLYACG
jgi:hypothetical protein